MCSYTFAYTVVFMNDTENCYAVQVYMMHEHGEFEIANGAIEGKEKKKFELPEGKYNICLTPCITKFFEDESICTKIELNEETYRIEEDGKTYIMYFEIGE